MNTEQINKILTRNHDTARYYLGCFASDQIIKLQNAITPHCFVVNFDPSYAPGSHWVAFHRNSPDSIEYFDSTGHWPPICIGILEYMKNFKKIQYNPFTLQSPQSKSCGKYVIIFLCLRCGGLTFEKIIKKLACMDRKEKYLDEFIRHKIFDSN